MIGHQNVRATPSAVSRAGREGVRRADRRRELARRRHGRAGLPEKALDEHARVDVRHGRAARPGAAPDSRAVPGVDRGRRAGRGDAGVDPHPQEDPRPLGARGGQQAGQESGSVRLELTVHS